MAISKTEKRNASKKVAETKSQAKKAQRNAKPQTVTGSAVKGKKSLGTGKK